MNDWPACRYLCADRQLARPAGGHGVWRRVQGRPSVSVVTVAELYAGARNHREEAGIERLLASMLVRDIDLTTARLAGRFCRDFRRSHGVEMPDALIAATARIHSVRLVTRNVRHFPMLDDLVVPYR